MFRSRGENLRSVYVLLFLNIALFLLQNQDSQRFAQLFAFDWPAVLHGDVWRLFTYQFVQSGYVGFFHIPPIVTLFLNLILLGFMGIAVEEEWGTSHFVTFYLISTLATAGAAAALGVPLLGSFFINFTLLFVYATLYRDQTFLLLVIPIRVTYLAWFAFAALVAGVFFGNRGNMAALGGAVAGYGYFLSQRVRALPRLGPRVAQPQPQEPDVTLATHNRTRVAAMKKALSTGSDSDIDRLIAAAEREVVPGVNICPPVDYKPEAQDGYCLRCEGFAECTARHLRLSRPKRIDSTKAVTEG
ncbi:MAG TPA: rhomboid family intramembrane serine protease [Thermoanaerobaculia bacterium]|nr:rhomboid family intramembrane serine protease [Thermoanaerobaculia bacterium]